MVYGYIYKIENLVNGKVYIGQTIQKPNKRFNLHLWELRHHTHDNSYLQNSFNKYGEANFKFMVLNYATTKEVLDKLEVDYINYFGCLNRKNGYNLRSGGKGSGNLSLETRQKIGNVHRGKIVSKETRMKLSKAHKGKKLSEETKKKLSKGFMGKKNHQYGIKRFGEPILKTSLSQRGRGLFGFTGLVLDKKRNPERRVWQSKVQYYKHFKSLGYYEDPLSAQIVHDIVFDEIHNFGGNYYEKSIRYDSQSN